MKVAKFGGSSLANPDQVQKVVDIVRADPEIKVIVVSAPGKSHPEDTKVTDLLERLYENHTNYNLCDEICDELISRFQTIARAFDIPDSKLQFESRFKGFIAEIKTILNPNRDKCLYIGEQFMAELLAEILGYTLVSADRIIQIGETGVSVVVSDIDLQRPVVVPGFYGADDKGEIKVFSRGGSDLTGALLAAAFEADVYENWTDVSGLLAADPAIIDNPLTIERISYREVRELSYMGARVIHQSALYPVFKAGIPTHIRNTNDPKNQGTTIAVRSSIPPLTRLVTGIAGKEDCTLITVHKWMMDEQVGFERRMSTVFEGLDVSLKPSPDDVDSKTFVVESADVCEGKLDKIVHRLNVICEPDSIDVQESVSLITVVGRGMVHRSGMAKEVTGALADADINIRLINQGANEFTIVLGVDGQDYRRAVEELYDTCVLDAL